MDDILDEALDELDDSSSCGSDHDAEDKAVDPKLPRSNIQSPALISTSEKDSKMPAQQQQQHQSPAVDNSQLASNPSNGISPPPNAFSAEDPSVIAFQQMLQTFIEADDDNNDNAATDIAAFMQQVQSQLDETTTTTASSTTTPSKATKSKPSPSAAATKGNAPKKVDDTIAAILGEMAKASLDDDSDNPESGSAAAYGATSNNDEEERMIQDMLQSLASGKMPQGMQDLLNDDTDSHNDDVDGSSDFLPDNVDPDAFMEGMMEQLLSKELMYEPMKQVTDKFPAWLQQHKATLSLEEWEQRHTQYKVFQELVQVYESDSGDGNNNKTERLMELMQQVQEYGQPPAEIIQEIAPGLQLDNEGMPTMMEGMPPFGAEAGDCVLM